MRHLGAALVVACACLLGGCYVSNLSGITDLATGVLDESLVGRWQSVEDDVEAVITRDEWQSYAVAWRDRSVEQQFTVRVTTLGETRFFDLTLQTGAEPGPVLLPVHVTGRLTLRDDALVVELLDYEWFARRLSRRQPLGVAAVIDERGTIIVTSPAAAWRRWLLSHAASREVFAEAWTLTRVPEVSK